jgi:uncharacterized membrane protein
MVGRGDDDDAEKAGTGDWALRPLDELIGRRSRGLATWGIGLSVAVVVGLLFGLLLSGSVPVYLASVALWLSLLASLAALLRFLAHGRGAASSAMDRLGKYFGLVAAVFAVTNSCIAFLFALSGAI